MFRCQRVLGLGAFILVFCLFMMACNSHKKIEIKKAKIGDIDIAYYIRGSGPPLIMIMGFRGTMAIWDPGLLELLEKHFTLILFDNRGVGLSTDTKEDLTTIPQMAQDTAQLIKALGYQKVHVLGWSMGSRIAQEVAIRYPAIVDHLILCSTNPGGKHQVPRTTNAYKEFTAKDLSRQKALSLLYPNTKAGRLASEAFINRLTQAIVTRNAPDDLEISDQTVERQVHALQLWNENNEHYEMLSQIKSPTLVAGGTEDALDNPENARIVACQIPFAWAAYFPGAGHAFLSQDYQQFADLVSIFIGRDASSSREPKEAS
jgi:pimeloyl-ACP methyl ester carboxylesterase